jgi:hypothetical protein
MFSFLKRKKQENKVFRSEMSPSERQREWDRKIEREAQKAREEDFTKEEADEVIYYKKNKPVQKRSSSSSYAVAPRKKTWKDMTESERRQRVKQRDAQLIKEYRDTERKLKTAAKKGGKAIFHAVEGLGIVANKVADAEKRGIKKAVKQKPLIKRMAKDVGKAGKKAFDGIGQMVDNHDRYYAKREKAAGKTTGTRRRKAPAKKVTVIKPKTTKTTKRKVVKRRRG